MTPDSQKSTAEQGTEKLTSMGDKAAGAVQPGDSKSTTQELGDKARSGADSTQNTAGSYLNQASDKASELTNKSSGSMPSAGEAQDTGKTYLNQASDQASDLTNKASQSMPSTGQAQDTGKTYLDQASEMASNAAKTVSDTLSGMSSLRLICPHLYTDDWGVDVANKISESGQGSK